MVTKKKAKVEEVTLETTEEAVTGILPLSVDYGREDINNIAMKVNEIIVKINAL